MPNDKKTQEVTPEKSTPIKSVMINSILKNFPKIIVVFTSIALAILVLVGLDASSSDGSSRFLTPLAIVAGAGLIATALSQHPS